MSSGEVFEIDTMPFPAHKVVASKYDETFDQLRPGQCVKCDSARVTRISAAMRKWLERQGDKTHAVRAVTNCPDGFGRVWLLPKKPPRMGDLPKRRVSPLGAE